MYLYLWIFLSLLTGNSLSIRCYSCNGFGGSKGCTSTIDCSLYSKSYCYKKTADIVVGGQTSRVTLAGCWASCSQSEKDAACHSEKNCDASCCGTSYCNSVTSKDSESSKYPKCHFCESTASYSDCDSRSTLKTCSYSADDKAHCYKASYIYTNFLTGKTKRIYKKDCTLSPQSCSKLRSVVCSGYSSSECEVFCCSGNRCNAGAHIRFSIYVVVVSLCVVFPVFMFGL